VGGVGADGFTAVGITASAADALESSAAAEPLWSSSDSGGVVAASAGNNREKLAGDGGVLGVNGLNGDGGSAVAIPPGDGGASNGGGRACLPVPYARPWPPPTAAPRLCWRSGDAEAGMSGVAVVLVGLAGLSAGAPARAAICAAPVMEMAGAGEGRGDASSLFPAPELGDTGTVDDDSVTPSAAGVFGIRRPASPFFACCCASGRTALLPAVPGRGCCVGCPWLSDFAAFASVVASPTTLASPNGWTGCPPRPAVYAVPLLRCGPMPRNSSAVAPCASGDARIAAGGGGWPVADGWPEGAGTGVQPGGSIPGEVGRNCADGAAGAGTGSADADMGRARRGECPRSDDADAGRRAEPAAASGGACGCVEADEWGRAGRLAAMALGAVLTLSALVAGVGEREAGVTK